METKVSVKSPFGWATIVGVCKSMAEGESDELRRNVLAALGNLNAEQMIKLAIAMNE